MVFPGGGDNGFASGLRAWQIAAALNHRGFRALVIPPQLEHAQRQRIYRREKPDIVFMQKCRDRLHRPSLFPESLCVLDLDDADFIDPRLRPIMQEVAGQCHGCIAGSSFIADWLKRYCNRVEKVWTGTHLSRYRPQSRPSERSKIVCWAVSNVLSYTREAEFVRDAAIMASKRSDFILRIQGGGDPKVVRAMFQPAIDTGITCDFIGSLPYAQFVRSLETAAVGLAPLVVEESSFNAGKSFGKVLGYLAADVPIVASSVADHPEFFRHEINGYLAETVVQWADAIVAILANPAKRNVITSEARRDLHAKLSLDASGDRVASFLKSLINDKEDILTKRRIM